MLPVKRQLAGIKRRLINYLKDWGDDMTIVDILSKLRGIWSGPEGLRVERLRVDSSFELQCIPCASFRFDLTYVRTSQGFQSLSDNMEEM